MTLPAPSPARRAPNRSSLALLAACLLAACASLDLERTMSAVGGGAGIGPALDAPPTTPDPAGPATCAARRQRVAAALGDGVLAIEAGADSDEGRYAAADDFWWLTAVSVPDALLLLEAEAGLLVRERLYLPERDERHELWNGPRLAPGAEATAVSGIADTRPFAAIETDVLALADAGASFRGAGARVERLLSERGVALDGGLRWLHDVQAVKDADEIAVMRAVVAITEAALADAMVAAVPGRFEYTAEAVLEAGFRRRGASGFAFPSIAGSGINGCILHYRDNARRLERGDLLLMDVGAKLYHYSADVTRTFPVSGRFTPRQLAVYTAVYEASRAAAAVLRPGATLAEANEVARQVLAAHGGYEAYFPHSVGHGLGLQVHDRPGFRDALEPGMVVTIEPGAYLAAEAIGVRIEDDYLITADGAELLSDAIPTEPAALEAFLARIRADR